MPGEFTLVFDHGVGTFVDCNAVIQFFILCPLLLFFILCCVFVSISLNLFLFAIDF